MARRVLLPLLLALCTLLAHGPGAFVGHRMPGDRSSSRVIMRRRQYKGMKNGRITRRERLRRQQLRKEQEEAGEAADEGEWKQEREEVPDAVKELASGQFLSQIRDGGPQAMVSDTKPPVDPNWIGDIPEDTARNVVNALCWHRYGRSVNVDRVFAGPDRPSGREYVVTLALGDKNIFGSCRSGHVGMFDRDLTDLLEALKQMDGWNQRIYKLKVQTIGTDHNMSIPDDLWKCELFPCKVVWKAADLFGRERDAVIRRCPGHNDMWQLAEAHPNLIDDNPGLTRKQLKKRYRFEESDVVKVAMMVDNRSIKRLRQVKWKLGMNSTEDDGFADPDAVSKAAQEVDEEGIEDEPLMEPEDVPSYLREAMERDMEEGDEEEWPEGEEEEEPVSDEVPDVARGGR